MNKAKELEKKYEWLQSSELYQIASGLVLDKEDHLKAAEFQEKRGFCFYKAAFQAKSHIQFRKILRQSVQAYRKASKNLVKVDKVKHKVKIKQANAYAAYVKSWYEIDPKKSIETLQKWWTLEKELLIEFERYGDLHSVGKICNDMNEFSSYDRFWLVSNFDEQVKMYKEHLILAEKAINIFIQLDDQYELCRAYWIASWYYGFCDWFFEDEKESIHLIQKCQDYADKSLDISLNLDDAWMIGRAYNVAWSVKQMLRVDPTIARQMGERMLKYGDVSKDMFLIGFGNALTSYTIAYQAGFLDNPDEQRKKYKKAEKMAQEATRIFQILNHFIGYYISYPYHSQAIAGLASTEINPKKKQLLFEKAKKICQEGLEKLKDFRRLVGISYESLSLISILLAESKEEKKEKKKILTKAIIYSKKNIEWQEEFTPFSFQYTSASYYRLALVQIEMADVEESEHKVKLLKQAIFSIEKSIDLAFKKKKMYTRSRWGSGYIFGKYYYKLGETIQKLQSQTEEEKNNFEAIQAYRNALLYFKKAEMPTYIAESYWHIAKLYSIMSKYQEASENYKFAAESFTISKQRISQLDKFYTDYSNYMLAWSNIEQAKYSHSIEDYSKAKEHYDNAANLHELTEPWSYLATNYLAWARMEEAEGLSRNESTQQAKQEFQKALEQFTTAENSIKQKLLEIKSFDEKEMAQRLLQNSDLRQKFCQARILMEEAKLLDRQGKYLQSSKSYEEAAQNITRIVEKMDVEVERKELEYVAVLCRAWEKMATAEEATSSESYLEAAELFEKAKELCYTKKASLWTLANSNFCKGLAAGIRYQGNMDLKENAKAKQYIKSSASSYLQAGFKNASEYAKATQRLFDAYTFMNQAENEVNPEKKTKQYQMAENLLQIAAGSFMNAKQPEKTDQVQQILMIVREEKALAVSLTEVMHAPSVTSSTFSFTAPTPTSETSVGLENFEHANVQANLITHVKEVNVGESFCLSLEFVNAGREPALLMRVDNFIPLDFVIVKKPEIYRIEENTLNLKGKQLAPLKLVEVKLTLQPSKKGDYRLNPRVHYLDEIGHNRSIQLKSIEINVEEVVLSNRISTGTPELDSLLLGGIPEGYAVALTGSPSDEREHLVKNFLERGVKKNEIVFYVSTEADRLENLLENPNFYLFLCNPKPKTQVPDLPNVFKLRSKTDLTNLSISLSKAYRSIDPSKKKRICVEIVSDVLVDYDTKATRKWGSELITDLGSKEFTMLAVMNSTMHASEQVNAVLDLFDGEITITQSDDPLDCKKSILVKKLRNQDYIKNPICLINPKKSLTFK